MNPKFPLTIINGKITSPSNYPEMVNRLASVVPDGRFIVEIKPYKKERSSPQNRYYWGVVVPMVFNRFVDLGELRKSDDKDIVHEYLKQKFCPSIDRVINNSILEIKSTSKLSTEDFKEYLEII